MSPWFLPPRKAMRDDTHKYLGSCVYEGRRYDFWDAEGFAHIVIGVAANATRPPCVEPVDWKPCGEATCAWTPEFLPELRKLLNAGTKKDQ